MALFNCFSGLVGRKKKDKGDEESSDSFRHKKGLKTLQVKLEQPIKSFKSDELNSSSFSVSVPFGMKGSSMCKVKVMSHESPVGGESAEVAYEAEDEQEVNSMRRDFSDLDLQAHVANSGEEEFQSKNREMNFSGSFDTEVNEHFEEKNEKDAEKGVEMIQSGHVSDPGIGKTKFWASPKLKRSCSDLETRDVLNEIANQLPPSKSRSFEELQELAEKFREDVGNPGSPGSVMTHHSADRVMLKKHSSSQVLPSRSRRLWWKLFLWSHRNLHKPWTVEPLRLPVSAASNQQGGYSSDTLEPNRAMELDKIESPGSFTRESGKNGSNNNPSDNPSWSDFKNQWVAFSAESSPFNRVDEWVKDLEIHSPPPFTSEYNNEEGIVFPPSPEGGRSPARSITHSTRRPNINFSEEILHANSVIQSLNSSSTVAHISGIGLKVIPTISGFSSLRSVNLSSNFIVHISPASLPKGLHTLNLSRNKINTIEGLRELTRLRVLDLSYNRIFRIGQGLSNCTLIKELYLAGNKISDVEGLHRLLKLTVLDLSFNKITTAKALGQLVANYNSLQALNLLGNPIQSNINDDQLRKAICGLLPKLSYLNKQPIKPQRAREVLMDSVAKAALGSSSLSSRRRAVKRVSQGGSVSSSGHRSSVAAGQKSRNKSKSRTQYRSLQKIGASALGKNLP
ncbi:hypothetical protein L1049_026910 [Liquidambar formosana]|uniref:Uncharacterized protein n=1 Tax=Liquidambar formosana TaxID=63359 RepID=A0AAP0R6T6_LIQFO